MKVSIKWLQKYFEKPLPDAGKMSDIFTFKVFEVESIENGVIDLKTLPDRNHYALCHRGIAEEYSLITGEKIKESLKRPSLNLLADLVNFEKDNIGDKKLIPFNQKINVKDSKFCFRYCARIIKNVKVTDEKTDSKEVKEIASLLNEVGARSINSIIDIVNYVMFDIGQPMHVFDLDKIKGEIYVRLAVEGEKITTLDNKDILLSASDWIIADDEGPLAIAGVKGGKRAEVTLETKNIILESANFNSTQVRKTSSRVSIKNDAVKRYENGIDANLAVEAMKMASELILKNNPLSEISEISDYYPNKLEIQKITLSLDFVDQKLGLNIDKKEVLEILKNIGAGVSELSDRLLEIIVPYHRLDLKLEEDFVEEIGRIYGYEKIGLAPIKKDVLKPMRNLSVYYSEIFKDMLVKMGWNEVYLYSFAPKGDLELMYPISADKSYLRKNILNGLEKVLISNSTNIDLLDLNEIKIFEFGKVFTKKENLNIEGYPGGIKESYHLAMGVFCPKKKGRKSVDSIKEFLVHLSEFVSAQKALNIPDYKIDFNSNVLEDVKIEEKGNVALCEIDLDVFFGQDIEINTNKESTEFIISESIKNPYEDIDSKVDRSIVYKKFSVFPYIVRDISIAVPDKKDSTISPNSSEKVLEIIENGLDLAGARNLVVKKKLFDVFSTKDKDNNSITAFGFRLIFQANDRTLSDDEVNTYMESVNKVVTSNGWKVR